MAIAFDDDYVATKADDLLRYATVLTADSHEGRTCWSIRRFVRIARHHRSIAIRAGQSRQSPFEQRRVDRLTDGGIPSIAINEDFTAGYRYSVAVQRSLGGVIDA